MKVRICTLGGVPMFDHAGIVATRDQWREHVIDESSPEGKVTIEALKSYVGHIVQIHPEDVKQFACVGLTVVGAKLVEPEAEEAEEPAPPVAADAKGKAKK